jgi:hypothetical protein
MRARLTPFTRVFLSIFAGPIVWAAHFLAIYVFVALACARHFGNLQFLGIGIVPWTVGILTVASLAVLAAALWKLPSGSISHDARFVRWLALATGALSALAIVWEAFPAYVLPACT